LPKIPDRREGTLDVSVVKRITAVARDAADSLGPKEVDELSDGPDLNGSNRSARIVLG
jgi:hypothetical protein